MPKLHTIRRTIAFDLPGHGAAVDWPEVPDAAACAKAVIASLEAMKIARASLVGHSLGGAVAAIVGLMRPDLVERLLLLAPGGFGPQMNVRLLKRYSRASEEAELALILEPFFGPTSAMPEAMARLMSEARSDPRLLASHQAIVEVITRGEGQGTLPLETLAAQPFPVQIVWGTDDFVLPVRQAMEAPARIARHLLPGVGHMPHLEAEDTVLAIIAQAVAGRYEVPAG